MQIERHINYFSELWHQSSTTIPSFKKNYTRSEQTSHEFHFENIVQKLKPKNGKKSKFDNDSIKPDLSKTALFHDLFVSIFGFDEGMLDLILSSQFKVATKDFIKMARKYDPEIDLNDIFQACRNAWIMNGIQLIFGLPVKVTPSIFAYSMLYPYSDNYLDDPKVTKEIKIEFSNRFEKRLKGEKVESANNHESKIFGLIALIESQYTRNQYPKVYDSLLAIHSAQTKSLGLLNPSNNLNEDQVLKLCIEKGGTSVMADGYLVAGDLSDDQERFFFGYGTYLQFIDDIQDVKEDSCAGLLTIFSQESKKCSLDDFANKTFHFGNTSLELINKFEGENLPTFKRLTKKSIESMLIETILLNENYYSSPYIQNLELYSPLSITYLKKRRSKMSSQRISYIKKIVESIIAN